MTAVTEYKVDAVVIGRNEGQRLVDGLASLSGHVRRVVYVDSGSTDHSVQNARAAGAIVIDLDMTRPFTAARARNAGLEALADDPPEFVQFLDGDCALDEGWTRAALAAFAQHPRAVVVCGRRQERFPDRSIYNLMADREWNTPIGPALACGGDALMRYAAVKSAGGYRADLIAGEEPELCLRLRRDGGEIWRIDALMTHHDAALTRFGQWWKRAVRAGHAFAEGAYLHGAAPERHWIKERNRAALWGGLLPVAILIASAINPAFLAVVLIYPAQILRLWARSGRGPHDLKIAALTVIGKFAEAQGIFGFWKGRITGRSRGLIEYK